MTRFLDGPAGGVTLALRRAPHFLRAVTLGDGTWDALDHFDDRPDFYERIVVYVMRGEPTWMHIRAAKGGGFYRGGAYVVVTPQPPDEVLRDETQWRAWAAAAFEAERGAIEGAAK